MKKATIAPAYVALFAGLSDVAQKHGYALAAHGSLVTDFDIVAVPWTPGAVSAEELVTAIAKHLTVCSEKVLPGLSEPEVKPHGRLAWLIPLKWGAIDISVIPRVIAELT